MPKAPFYVSANNGRLQKMTFGNDQTVEYSYDKFDRTTKERQRAEPFCCSKVSSCAIILKYV